MREWNKITLVSSRVRCPFFPGSSLVKMNLVLLLQVEDYLELLWVSWSHVKLGALLSHRGWPRAMIGKILVRADFPNEA